MPTFKKALVAFLAALMCTGTLACAKPSDHPSAESSTDGYASNTRPLSETALESEIAPSLELPSDLNFQNTDVNIYCQAKSIDLVGDIEADIVSAAVFERNTAVEERLKVKLNMVEIEGENYTDTFRTLILANDDSIDMVAGYQWRCIPQAQEGLYRNVAESPYLDWEKPWWGEEYMNTIQLGDKRYVMIGDISLVMLHSMSAFFVNKRLYEDEFEPIDELYADVFAGKWTWEKMTTCVSQIYRDANGNNKTDEGDILGMRSFQASPTDHMAYTAGLALSTRDEDGNIVLIDDQARNIEIAEAMFSLIYENSGCYINKTPETFQDFFLYSFAEGKTLFNAYTLDAAEYFREMTDEYAIITHPKFDELQEDYKTLIHDVATTFSLPTTVDDEEMDMLAAVLEAMCYESYKRVTPVYFDVVLKSRYSSDPKSAQAIDMIRANVFTDFLYANNYSLSAPLGTIMRTLIGEGHNKYASTYRGYRRLVEQNLKHFNEHEAE